MLAIYYFAVKIFSWILLSHKKYSLEHFQQQNNSRQKFSRLRYYTTIAVENLEDLVVHNNNYYPSQFAVHSKKSTSFLPPNSLVLYGRKGAYIVTCPLVTCPLVTCPLHCVHISTLAWFSSVRYSTARKHFVFTLHNLAHKTTRLQKRI